MSHSYVPRYANEEQDVSESECFSDGHLQASDLTELYRRKQVQAGIARNTPVGYYTAQAPGYYEQNRYATPTCPCSQPADPRYCYCRAQAPMQERINYTPHQYASGRGSNTTVKKYPVTGKTPKYYRRPASPICRRPSTLCLPVISQPDPAVAPHRHRRARHEPQHYQCAERARVPKPPIKKTDLHSVHSEGDVNSRLNDLEHLLTKFEDDVDNNEDEPIELSGVNEISKILKPKLPPSLKDREDTVKKLRAVKANENDAIPVTQEVSELQVKAVPQESLNVILRHLGEDVPKEGASKEKKSPEGGNSKNTQVFMQKILDDNSALELHKSKSFIVNLIDKALSNELGTIPGNKCDKADLMNMNPKRAIEMVNRHAGVKVPAKTGSGSMEIAASSVKSSNCHCRPEDPPYLKHLKALRWSHLRHIQREAKRLADLEKFLDSVSEIESPR